MTGFDAFLNELGNVVLYAATAGLTVVIFYYHRTAKWWKSPEGRHSMAWTLIIWSLLLLSSFTNATLLSLDVRLILRVVVFGLFLWLAIWQFRLIALAQRVPTPPFNVADMPGPDSPTERHPAGPPSS